MRKSIIIHPLRYIKETEVDKLEVGDLEEPATADRYEYQFAAAPVRPGWSFLKSVGTRPWFQRYLPNTSDTLGFKDLYKERLEDKVNPLHHPFVCLHDRLGAANDICHDLYQLEALHEALIHNPKTGIPLGELLSALLEDPLTGVETAKARYQAKKQGHHNFESYEKQYLLAASTFSAIQLELERLQYTQAGSAEAIDELNKQRAKVDWAAITQILQIRARKHMRVDINNTRSSLLTLLQSDYYQHLLLAEFNDYADRLHGFKGELITHDTMLAREPRARDADIVLFYQKRIDLDQYFEQKLAADSPFSKLMEQEVNVGEKILSAAEGGWQILSILETYISYCKGEKEIKIITKYLNSIKLSDFEFKTALATLDDILAYAEEIGLDARLRGSANDKNIISRTILDVLDSGESIPYIRIAPRATATIRKVDELLQKAKLEEVGMGLAVFNLANSIRATQENDGRSATHKAVVIGAASFAVTHSLASYLYARKEMSKRLIGRAVSKKLVTRIGYVGDCLTIVESIFNVRQAFLEKNEMQAFAYMGATAAVAASLVFSVKGVSISLTAIMASRASVSSIALVVLKAVWPILVLAALFVFFSWLAARYAFSPLVRFFANYLFNQVELKKLGLDYSQLTTEAIMQVIDAKKEQLVSDTFGHWRDYNNALLELEGLYPMVGVEKESIDLQRKWKKVVEIGWGPWSNDKIITYYFKRVNLLIFRCQLMQISADMGVEYGLFSYSEGSPDGRNKMVNFRGFAKPGVDKNKMVFEVLFDLKSIKASDFYQNGYFYIRLVLSESQGVFWPNQLESEPRYFFVKVSLKDIMSVSRFMKESQSYVFKYPDFLMPTNMPTNNGDVKEVEGSFLNLAQAEADYEAYRKRDTFFAQTLNEFKQEHNISEVIEIEKNK